MEKKLEEVLTGMPNCACSSMAGWAKALHKYNHTPVLPGVTSISMYQHRCMKLIFNPNTL